MRYTTCVRFPNKSLGSSHARTAVPLPISTHVKNRFVIRRQQHGGKRRLGGERGAHPRRPEALAHANLTSCESLWWYAGRDANQKDWCIPLRCKKGKEVDGRKWTTKWELLTGHRPRVTQHYPFGCLCYMLTYHPDSKVAQRGVRCLNFGRAEGQPGYTTCRS